MLPQVLRRQLHLRCVRRNPSTENGLRGTSSSLNDSFPSFYYVPVQSAQALNLQTFHSFHNLSFSQFYSLLPDSLRAELLDSEHCHVLDLGFYRGLPVGLPGRLRLQVLRLLGHHGEVHLRLCRRLLRVVAGQILGGLRARIPGLY